MVEDAPQSPTASAAGAARAARRDARLAAALRANLSRRKTQARGREAAEPDSTTADEGADARAGQQGDGFRPL